LLSLLFFLTKKHHHMDCFKGYIGLRGCNSIEPASGMYINDLEGINLENIERISDGDQLTYVNVWRDVENRGLRKFTNLITAYFRTKYRIKKLLDRYYFGQYKQETTTAPAAELRGIEIKLNPDQTDAEISPFITFQFTHLQFWATADATIDFKIIDLESRDELWAESIDVVANKWNDINAQFTAPALQFTRRIGFVYDATTVTSADTFLSQDTGSDDCCDGGWVCGCGCNLSGCCDAKIRGIRIDAGTLYETYAVNNTFALRGFSSLRCSYDGLLCANRDLFAVALWYYLGAEMMRERMHSSRINKFTTVDRNKAKELKEAFDEVWQMEMEVVVDAIDLNAENCCIECTPLVGYEETLL
jgi:hypothetical protein